MKTKIFFTIIFTIMFAFQLDAQINVFNNGTVGIGNTSIVPSGYNVNMYGWAYMMGGANTSYGNYTLTFNCMAKDPRIGTNSLDNLVVFYNSDNGVYVDIQCGTLYQHSDANSKTNINPLKNGLNTIKQLRGVTYNWKNSSAANMKSKPVKLEYGLIAQEVEKVVPSLVKTDDSIQGKSLSYSGVIPILIEAIKDLSSKVDSLETLLNTSNGSLKSATVTTDINSKITSAATLSQNAPNPFSQSTNISYYVPETVQLAVLNVYDMNGLQIKSVPVISKGKGSITINGYEFHPGMYLYTLIADGQEVSTKRMILTQ